MRLRHRDRDDVEIVVGDRCGDEADRTIRAIGGGPEQPFRVAGRKARERDTAPAAPGKASFRQRERLIVPQSGERRQLVSAT